MFLSFRALSRSCLLVACGSLSLLAACGKRVSLAEETSSAPPPPPVNAKADRLAPMELVAGPDKAYALPLPRELKITFRFAKAIHAEGPAASEAVSNFIRARVQDGEVRVGASETQFEGVRVSSEPGRPLRIRVYGDRGFSKVIVEDATKSEVIGTPEERMRNVGLTPDGKLIDDKKVE
jgi:hypothetical protein